MFHGSGPDSLTLFRAHRGTVTCAHICAQRDMQLSTCESFLLGLLRLLFYAQVVSMAPRPSHHDSHFGHSYFVLLSSTSNLLLPWSRKFPCPRLHHILLRQPPATSGLVAPVDIIANSQVTGFCTQGAGPFPNPHSVPLVPFCPTNVSVVSVLPLWVSAKSTAVGRKPLYLSSAGCLSA